MRRRKSASLTRLPRRASLGRASWLPLAAIVLAGVGVYWNSISSPFL